MGKQSPAATAPPAQRVDEGGGSLSAVALTATIVAGLLDAAPDGLLMIDADGTILLVTSRLEDMFGYTRSELLGQPVELLLPESVREAHVAHRAAYSADPRVRPMGSGLTLLGRRADGTEFPVEISLSPLATTDGQWAIAAIRDDTERRSVEDRRRDDAVFTEQGRIATDLGDLVIRGLFGTGLLLQGLLERGDDELRAGVQQAIGNIDNTIRDIRTAIFGLSDRRPST